MTRYKIALSRYALTRKLPPGDPLWARFNASFENLELEADEIVDPIYRGQAITTQHTGGWRSSDNYLAGQHLGLDFDGGDLSSHLPALLRDKFVARYAAFAYTTISHTPAHPRARVIFLLDTPIQQAKNYALAAAALVWMFGTADPKCKDAARFFYGSPGCQMEYLGRELPLEVLKRVIEKYRQSGKTERLHQQRAIRPAPPVEEQEIQAVRAALAAIPAWGIDYAEWVSILMALHAGLGDRGYPLAEQWAQGTPGEVARKWRSFKQNGNARGVVTPATLFAIARRFGWRSGSAQ